MTNNNPGGANQLGGYEIQPQYGDVKRETQLMREAPISGAPFSALEAPRRAQRSAGKPRAQAQPQAAPPSMPVPQIDPSSLYRQIAQIPGITPQWRQLLG